MTDSRRLIVMRHARAEPFASSDRARRLTDRGVQDARQAGARLAATGFVPDHAVISAAERTRMTWAAVRETSGSTATESFEDAAYQGDAENVLELLREVPAGAETVVVVGHNPTAADLCHLLDDGSGDPDALTGLLRGFPPGALGVFEVSSPWSELTWESGRVVDFYAPGS